MKALRIVMIAVLSMALVFSLAACAQTPAPVETAPAETESTETEPVDEVSEPTPEAEILVMATNAQFPPYEFYEGDKIVGIDVEIAELIAEKLGMTLKIEDMEFDSIIPAVQSGKVDMGMAGLTVTEERKRAVNFTASYATGKQVIIVREDSDIASADDLENKTIGVQLSTTGDLYITWDLVDEGLAKIERYNKGADAVQALSQGKIDAVVIDNEPARVFVEMNKGLKILETEYVTEEYAICIAKGNTQLLEKVDAALKELIASGEVQAILDKYIKAE